MKKTIMFLLAAMLFMLPAQTAMASEMSVTKGEVQENSENMIEMPTLEMINDEDGTFLVTATDCDGNVIFAGQKMSGSVEEIVEHVYMSIYNEYDRKAKSSCTHIPCNQEKVWGNINHIINGDTCTMVKSQFYKCKCCGAIIGMVSNSTVIVGTHPAH